MTTIVKRREFYMRKAIIVLALAIASLMLVPLASATGGNGGGHTPVTVCHKPGTPAQQSLTFDDDALWAHLNHGDTLGPCTAPPPPPVCPEGFTASGQSNGVLLCTKTNTITNTVFVDRPVEKIVYVNVPGPTVYVEKTVTVDRPVPGATVTKIVKVKGKTKYVYKTKVKVKTVVKTKVAYGLCKMPNGKIGVPGAG